MDLQLKGKKVFISGSTSGIGYATAKILLQEGADVTINGRSEKRIKVALKNLKKVTGTSALTGIAADFSDKNAVKILKDQLNDIDILINNVGIYKSRSFFETSDEDWYDQFEVNVMSGVRLSRHCLPIMLNKNWGRILFISSECAQLIPNDLIAYSTTKTALLSISRGLAQLTKGSGVTVNTVLPGSTLSEGAQNFINNVAGQKKISVEEVSNNFFKQVRTSSLLQRFASVDEVASTICYLVSPLSSATNGAVIKVDGGSTGGII